MKNIFQMILYSPNLEGIKDALCYKFIRLTIDQNCSAVYTRVAIELEMHSQTNGTKCRAFQKACSAGHQALSEARDEVCSLS